MPRAAALIHLEFEDLGTLEPELRRAGYQIEVVHACTSDLGAAAREDPDLLVVLGGPVGVYEQEDFPFLGAELDWIRARLNEKRPTIGICLGAQLIAAAAGASVYAGGRGKEIGWGPIKAGRDAALYPGFGELLKPDLRLLHWHGDTFDLPANSHHLAGTAAYPNQAFTIERHTLGLQFHPEVTAQGLERWYVGHAGELKNAGIRVPQLRRDSEILAPKLEEPARRFWRKWLSGLRPLVKGIEVDAQTRCAHYRKPEDVVAIKMKCCGVYYACKDCHEALAGHAIQVWPRGEWERRAVLCGSCGTEMTIRRYLECGSQCPNCQAPFNPGCRNHYHLYFEISE
ncbi:MAG: glutamine amidotransferase [Bryobacteraceae bacterium]